MKQLLFLKFHCLLLLVAGNIAAQELEKKEQEFKIFSEIRPRLEYFHGYKSLVATNQTHGLAISQRTRLNMDFKNPNLVLRLSIQDVRVWGSQNLSAGNEDYAVSVYEAWGEALITPVFSLKLGRQEISYDDQRIFGVSNWGQQARSHDAAIIKIKTEKFRAELALAYNQDALNYGGTDNIPRSKNYKALQNLWMNYKFNDNLNASFLFLNNGMQQNDSTGNAYSQTIGPWISFDNKKIAAHAAFYYQAGKDAELTKINANYFWIDASCQFGETFKALAGYERLSGNSEIETSDENKAFTPFYGSAHTFNGHMDYFYSSNHIGSVGLNDIFLQLNLELPKFSVGLHSHYFSAAADIADPVNTGDAMDRFLGLEFDLFCDFKLTKDVAVKAGYSQMFATESMEVLKEGDKDETNNWAFLMVTFKPTLFEHKKEIKQD
jgi:hypothetical protein